MTPESYDERYYRADDGLRLFYRDYAPRGETAALPVLCLPGLTRNSRDFELIAEIIAVHHRLIAPDMRGRGRSAYDPDWHHYHPYRYVADVWKLLDDIGVARCITLGTSLGGVMSALMAHQWPGAVVAAVVNDIGPEVDPAGLGRISRGVGTLPVVASWEDAVVETKRAYAGGLPGLSEDLWRWFAESTYRQIRSGELDLNFDRNIGVAVRAGIAGLRDDPWMLFDALTKGQVMLLRGELSDVLAAATVARMQARYPRLSSVTITNRGHVPLLNEPDATAAIDRFLAEVRESCQ